MPVRIEQIATTDFDGSNTRKTLATAKCDGPNCHKADTPCKGFMAWEEAQNEEQLKLLPDEVFHLIVLSHLNGQKVVFFGRNCLKEFMRDYVPPKSPREVAEQLKAAAAVLQKHGQQSLGETAPVPKVEDSGDQISSAVGGTTEAEAPPKASAVGAGDGLSS